MLWIINQCNPNQLLPYTLSTKGAPLVKGTVLGRMSRSRSPPSIALGQPLGWYLSEESSSLLISTWASLVFLVIFRLIGVYFPSVCGMDFKNEDVKAVQRVVPPFKFLLKQCPLQDSLPESLAWSSSLSLLSSMALSLGNARSLSWIRALCVCLCLLLKRELLED